MFTHPLLSRVHEFFDLLLYYLAGYDYWFLRDIDVHDLILYGIVAMYLADAYRYAKVPRTCIPFKYPLVFLHGFFDRSQRLIGYIRDRKFEVAVCHFAV